MMIHLMEQFLFVLRWVSILNLQFTYMRYIDKNLFNKFTYHFLSSLAEEIMACISFCKNY